MVKLVSWVRFHNARHLFPFVAWKTRNSRFLGRYLSGLSESQTQGMVRQMHFKTTEFQNCILLTPGGSFSLFYTGIIIFTQTKE